MKVLILSSGITNKAFVKNCFIFLRLLPTAATSKLIPKVTGELVISLYICMYVLKLEMLQDRCFMKKVQSMFACHI